MAALARERLPESLWSTVGVWRTTTAKGTTELQHIRGAAHAEHIVAGAVDLETAQREHDAAQRIAAALANQRPTLAALAFPDARAFHATRPCARCAAQSRPDAWSSALKGRRILERTR